MLFHVNHALSHVFEESCLNIEEGKRYNSAGVGVGRDTRLLQLRWDKTGKKCEVKIQGEYGREEG